MDIVQNRFNVMSYNAKLDYVPLSDVAIIINSNFSVFAPFNQPCFTKFVKHFLRRNLGAPKIDMFSIEYPGLES